MADVGGLGTRGDRDDPSAGAVDFTTNHLMEDTEAMADDKAMADPTSWLIRQSGQSVVS